MSPASATCRAEPAVSPATTALRPSARMALRHWPSAWMWLSTVLTVFSDRALQRHQLMMHRHEMLGDDVQPRMRHQMMNVGDAAGDRILDRDHRQIGACRSAPRQRRPRTSRTASACGPDRPAGRRGRNWRPARPGRRSCVCSLVVILMACSFAAGRRTSQPRASSARAISRSSGVSTPSGTVSTMRHVDAHAGFEQAQLFELFALFQRRRRQRDEALECGAAVGVKPDVMIKRAVAIGRGRAGEIERAQTRRR